MAKITWTCTCGYERDYPFEERYEQPSLEESLRILQTKYREGTTGIVCERDGNKMYPERIAPEL